MLDFEKNVVQIFESNNINFDFNTGEHYLISEQVSIIFIPVCSQKEFIPKREISIKAIKIIRLWEDEYRRHKEIINSRILSLIGLTRRIFARETLVKVISKDVLMDFLSINHLNVPIIAKHRYGLYFKQELVAVAAFGRSCPIQENDTTYKSHELIRYCSLLNVTVVGGLSKLIHYFEKEKKPEHIMTYIDREWSEGANYIKLGFEIVSETPPENFWLSPVKMERLSEKILIKNKSTNHLRSKGWIRIENLGNLKLVKFLI